MNISNPSNDKIVGVELKIPQNSDDRLYSKILALFKKLNINNIFVKLYPENFKCFNDFISDHTKDWQLTYAHTPLLNNIILKDLHKTKQIFQPLLFCRKNYFKQHKSWGYPIFYFTDKETEIYNFSADTSEINQSFEYPEDIVAIILLQQSNGTNKAKNIIQMLDRKSGSIKLKVKQGYSYKLLVIRKLFLYYENGLHYKLNIHDEYLLKKQSELASAHIGTNNFKGAYLDADDFFSYDGFITSGPEITRNYRRISENAFKPDMAQFWTDYGNNNDVQNINYTRMINTYIDGILLPKLYYIHQTTHLKANILNPFFVNNLAALKTIYKIKDEHFIFNKKYFIKAIINIKRIAAYKRMHDDRNFAVIFDDLININHSFYEKKISIDALLGSGVNKIYFKYDAESDTDSFILKNIFEKPETIKLYSTWLKYINRLCYYIQNGKPAAKILLLFPSLDSERQIFEQTVAELEKSCFDYDIMDFQVFINDDQCLIDQKKIFFHENCYHSIILAGIDKIPLRVLKKISMFINSGGIAIGMGELPKHIEKQEDQERLKELIKNIWLEKSNIPATNYKKHPHGGIGYFQKDIKRLIPMLSEEQNIQDQMLVYTTQPFVKIKTMDYSDYLVVFITNTSNNYQENIVLTCKSMGNFFRVSPEDDLLHPLYSIEYTKSGTLINLSLEKNESVLIKIEKKKTTALDKSEKVPDLITHEYIDIKDQNWVVKLDDRQEAVSLGDRSTINPYEWQPVVYSKTIGLDNDHLKAAKIFVQFGDLRDWCILYVNNQKVSGKLYPPWEFEITHFIQQGKNLIQLEIGHSISNYLATRNGDEHSVIPVAAYGLFGPVRLRLEHHQPQAEIKTD